MVKAGHTVGNHTWGHARLANVETEVWLKQVSDCHEHLHKALGSKPVWFRYPHLCYGKDQAQRDRVTAALAALGERNAPVTVATTEWLFAYVYRRALRTADVQLQQEVAAAWHSHMDASLQAGIEAAAELPGRAIPQTVLVHINELVIDELGVLIQRWKDQEIAFVDLETAMSDPVFAMDNQYSGQAGLSWLWRIRSREQYGSYWFGIEQGRVEQQLGAIDPLDKGDPL